jgi:hypothetical protein
MAVLIANDSIGAPMILIPRRTPKKGETVDRC